MQAVILAAGMGKRLKELTNDNTKCMIQVNGVTLIERMLRQLEKRHLSRIVIVVGYKGKKLIDYIDELKLQTRLYTLKIPIMIRQIISIHWPWPRNFCVRMTHYCLNLI